MLTALWPVAALIGEFLVKLTIVCIVIVRQRGRPQSILAWSVVILAVPVVGVIAYLIVGEVRLGARRVQRHREIQQRIQDPARVPIKRAPAIEADVPSDYRHIAQLATAVGNESPRAGNALRLIGDTDLFIQSLVEDIDRAEHHCHLLFYIFLADHSGQRVAEALMQAAGRGVATRLLVDAVGSKDFAASKLRGRMEQAGVRVVAALPAKPVRMLLHRIDLRNHRKAVVVDGAIGYVGSHNIADAEFAVKPRYAPWVDAMVRVEGPVAHDLQLLFVQDWYMDTDESLEDLLALSPLPHLDGVTAQVIGTGPNTESEAMQQLAIASIHSAREELILTTPYFVPDQATMSSLCVAARRGVETHLVVPARNDSPVVALASRSFYEPLLDAGVRISEYQRGLLHAKTMTVDRSLALVSTANFDRRSFELNFEVSMLVYDSDFSSELRFLQRSYQADSTDVSPGRWKRRRWPRRLAQNTAGLLSPLL